MAQEERGQTPQETSYGLPIISEDTSESLWATYTGQESWGQHLKAVKTRLLLENPHLVRFIESQVGKYPPQLHQAMFEIFVATIAILEHQAMSNHLSSKMNENV